MSEPERRFTRWRREPDPGPGYTQIPADGACLSVFLIIREASGSPRLLLGTPHPSADWGRIGGLEPARLARLAGHLMLPSSHLIEYESPQEGAARIASEQLGLVDLPLAGPEVVSDAYGRPGAPDRHWDLDFLFRANWPAGRPLSSPNWSRLEFADPQTLLRARFGRAHDDILRFAGFATAD
ncbi:MAG: hypothetical protein L3K18_00510 [Thermoplasmata archaeon]|nr:hypothetical protein [Thermoplasmata archaeon]MCI4355612.1 hypothetical protein [Thermoplasmata archaeon]